MNLKEHKTILEQVLSKDDYSKLEKFISNGLELEKGGISKIPDSGSKNLKKLIEELPNYYKKFEKLKTTRKKILKYERSTKKFCDFVPSNYCNATAALFLPNFSGSLLLGVGYFVHAAFSFGTPEFMPSLFIGIACSGLLANDIGHLAADSDRYYNLFALPVSAALYSIYKLKKKRNTGLAGEQKIPKMERNLANSLAKVYSGNTSYSENWLKREALTLKEKLKNTDDDFKPRFVQVENKLAPYDKLFLYRQMEQCLKQDYLNTEENLWDAKRLLSKFELAEKVGVQVRELREKLLQDFKNKVRELTNEKEHLQGKIEKYKKLLKENN